MMALVILAYSLLVAWFVTAREWYAVAALLYALAGVWRPRLQAGLACWRR
jgi:hypothetical protein